MKYASVISDRVRRTAIHDCLEEQLRRKRAFKQDHRQVREKRTGGVLNKHTLWGPHTDWRRLIWECLNLSLCFYIFHLFISLTLFVYISVASFSFYGLFISVLSLLYHFLSLFHILSAMCCLSFLLLICTVPLLGFFFLISRSIDLLIWKPALLFYSTHSLVSDSCFVFMDISQPFLIMYRLVLLPVASVNVPHNHFLQVLYSHFALDIYWSSSQKHATFQAFEVVVH